MRSPMATSKRSRRTTRGRRRAPSSTFPSPPNEKEIDPMSTRKHALMIAAAAALFAVTGAMAAGDPAAGKAKAAGCAGCHGANGEGVKPNPALAGKSESDIVAALKDYKSGKRANA